MTRHKVLQALRALWPGYRVWAEVGKGGFFCDRNGVKRCRCFRKGCQTPGESVYSVGTETWCRAVMGTGHSWEEAIAEASR